MNVTTLSRITDVETLPLCRCWPQGWAACTRPCPPNWRFPVRSGTACTGRTGCGCRPWSSSSTPWSSATLWYRLNKQIMCLSDTQRLHICWCNWWLDWRLMSTFLFAGGASWHQRPARRLHLQWVPRACACSSSPQGSCSTVSYPEPPVVTCGRVYRVYRVLGEAGILTPASLKFKPLF